MIALCLRFALNNLSLYIMMALCFRFTLYDLYTEGFFLIDLMVEVCLEATNVENCDLSIVVLKNFYLPKQNCSGDPGFATPGTYIVTSTKYS